MRSTSSVEMDQWCQVLLGALAAADQFTPNALKGEAYYVILGTVFLASARPFDSIYVPRKYERLVDAITEEPTQFRRTIKESQLVGTLSNREQIKQAHDDAMARLESDAVNRVVMESNRGYAVLYQAIKDALLLKNGIVKAWLDEDKGTRRVRVSVVDPLRFIVGPDQDCPLLEDYGGFCAEQKDYTRGDLVEMGFDKALVSRVPVGDVRPIALRPAPGTVAGRTRSGPAPAGPTRW